MRLTISISPCPNDTFMFDAMLNGRIDTEGLTFDTSFADIEQLNQALLAGGEQAPQISKCSCAAIPQIADRYVVLDSGSALGKGNGPLLVAANGDAEIGDSSMRIAIPGVRTTANLLMERLHPRMVRKEAVLFSDIMDKLLDGSYDAGVLIHEGRFVYRRRGLHLLSDLGLEWEKCTGLPLPLGAIAASRGLSEKVRRTVERVLRRSIEYAFASPEASAEFVRSHAQEMDPEVTRQHIALFVNDYSLSLGAEGRRSVSALLDVPENRIFD